MNGLTPRELEVLNLVCDGFTYGEIADRLNRSPYTIKQHVASLHAKTGSGKVALLVRWAIRQGLVTP